MVLPLAVSYGGPYGPPGAGWGGGGPWMLLGPIWLLFWIAVVAGVIFFVIRGRRGWRGKGWGPGRPGGPFGPGGPWGPPPPTGPDGQPVPPPEPPELALERARAILHERYARGDISTEEYRERIDNLV